ncbi:MAG: hypothetical protein ACEY3J_04600 [Arsenophonus sp.]
MENKQIWLRAVVCAINCSKIIRAERYFNPEDAQQASIELMEELLNQ